MISVVALGFVLGVRHATDPDHVIAIATIVPRQHTIYRAALIGISWGIGHTLTIVALGGAVIAFELAIPARVGLSMELGVGVMLVVLGFINVRSFTGSMPKPIALPGGNVPAVIATAHERGGYLAGLGVYVYVRPLMVGFVHGMAGSAAIALLALATIHNPRWAVAYLLLFGIGTVAGMVLITVSMASAFRVFAIATEQWSRKFAVASGVLSVAFGCLVTFQTLLLDGLLTGHPNWTPK